MLYALYDMQRAALKPMRLWAEATKTLCNQPFVPLPYAGFARAMAAGAEMVERSTRRYEKPAFEIGHIEIAGEPVAVTERVVYTLPFCELRHFSVEGRLYAPRVLVVAPMSGHHATLLRDTVATLLPHHDVSITDWVDARLVPLVRGPFDLDDYADYVMDCLRFLGPETHVIAVCQSSVPVLMAAAVMAEDDDPCLPQSMTLMGGPIDVRVNPTGPCLLAQAHSVDWFERTVITQVPFYYPGAFRRVFPGFVQLSGFMSMNFDRHVMSHIDFFNHLIVGDGESAETHRRFYDEYMSVMDMPAEYYLDTVVRVFQNHDLPQGRMTWRGRRIDLAAIRRTALLTIEGALDDISGTGQTEAAHRLCPNIPPGRRTHRLQEGVGHFGIFNGRRWRTEIAPALRAFIAENDGIVAARAA